MMYRLLYKDWYFEYKDKDFYSSENPFSIPVHIPFYDFLTHFDHKTGGGVKLFNI